MSKEDELLKVVNKMIESCVPIKYNDLNYIMKERENGLLLKLESEDDRVGIRLIDYSDESKGYCTSTLALISTITDTLIGKRLAFVVNEEGYIEGVKWYDDLKS